MPFLVLDRDGKRTSIPLSVDQPFTVGRLPGNSLPLEGQSVSRKHCVIAHENGNFVLRDTGSTLGTRLNGKEISAPAALSNDDEIQVGEYVLVFADDRTDSALVPEQSSEPQVGRGAAIQKDAEFAYLDTLYSAEVMALKKRIHELILTRLKLADMALRADLDSETRAKVEVALDAVLREVRHELPGNVQPQVFRNALLDELINFGPISPLLADESISEVMVNAADRVFIDRRVGGIIRTGVRFYDERHLMTIIRRIVEPLGRRVDESSPMVDARLPDGSRVNAIIKPLAIDGASVTIRKFTKHKLTTDDLIRFGSLTKPMADFMREAVRSRQNILISGGTGSGKTTLLNIVSQFIPERERIVTVEDSAELRLTHEDIVRLEARPPNIEGKGRVSIRDLVINCLRMRPDRIIVGECRGAEAFDMLQAMNTGHDGSLTTIHANTPRDSLLRLENMVLMAGYELPSVAIREQISSAIDLVIQQERMVDGTRKITKISEITGREGDVILTQDIFVFEQSGFGAGGKVLGRFRATGNIPRFIEQLKLKDDLRVGMSIFRSDGSEAKPPREPGG